MDTWTPELRPRATSPSRPLPPFLGRGLGPTGARGPRPGHLGRSRPKAVPPSPRLVQELPQFSSQPRGLPLGVTHCPVRWPW